MLFITAATLALLVTSTTSAQKNVTTCADDLFYRRQSCGEAGLAGDENACTIPFMNANASGTAGFAINQTLLGPTSGDFNWTFTVNARQPFQPAHDEQAGGDIETGIWYAQPDGIDLHQRGLPFATCAVVFIDGSDRTLWGLTQDTLEKGQHDDGTCSSMLSQQCITDLTQTAANLAQNRTARSTLPAGLDPNSAPGLALKNICDELASAVNISVASAVSSCRPFFNSTVNVAAAPITPVQSKCNAKVNGTRYSLIGDFNYLVSYMDTYSAANRLWYNSLVTRVTPIMTVFMPAPNSSQVERIPSSQALMNCIRPTRYNTTASIEQVPLDYSAPLSTLPARFYSFSSNESVLSNTTTATSPTSEGSTLSGGAIGGIVIGVVTGVILVVGLVILYFRRRKGSRVSEDYDHDPSQRPSSGVTRAEKMGEERFELDGTDTYELDARKSSIVATPLSAFGLGHGEKSPTYQSSPPPLPAPPPLPPHPAYIAARLKPDHDVAVSP